MMDVRGRVNWLCSRQVIPFDLEPVSPDWTAFLHVASHWPGLGPAADRLLCCTTKKSARKRTPLSRPLRGCPLSGSVRRGLRKLALRAQTCAALFPPAEPSSRRARGERKCRLPTVSANSSLRRGSVHRKSPFRAAVAGRVCKPDRGKIPAKVTPNTGKPISKGSRLPCRSESAFHT